jgi:hypothetical protein
VSRLFISLYLDEDVSTLIADLLHRRGFVAVTARDAGQLGKTDVEQLAYAAERQMAILTHNRSDYEELARQYAEAGRSHSGIFVAVRRQPHAIARRVAALLDRITADEMDNQLLYL